MESNYDLRASAARANIRGATVSSAPFTDPFDTKHNFDYNSIQKLSPYTYQRKKLKDFELPFNVV
jgi:hypothetical protein